MNGIITLLPQFLPNADLITFVLSSELADKTGRPEVYSSPTLMNAVVRVEQCISILFTISKNGQPTCENKKDQRKSDSFL